MSSLEQELARRGAELVERRLSGFDPRLLARLALLPEWTEDLAESVSLTGGAPLRETLERLEDAGVLERRRVLGARGRRQEAFWVRTGMRDALAAHMRARLGDDLDAECGNLERAIRARYGPAPNEHAPPPVALPHSGSPPLSDPAGSVLPPGVAAWLFAAACRTDHTGLDLVESVDELIGRDDLATASRVVTAAEVIGQTLGGPLADAARRAGWRVDRLAREADDAEHLRHYLHREEAESALTELILGEGEGEGRSWALHLLGGGGTGKTMLIRHLASGRFAADRGVPAFPVARADFDHLDPRYPEQRPGELLHALAGELLGYGMHRQTSTAFRAFEDASLSLTEELARTAPDPARVDQLLESTVSWFAGLVGSLPAPVVLVLDTCEELAKLYPPGSTAPGIEHTFRLLELLHEAMPRLRVVLAGRRWLVPPPEPLTAGPVLTARPYVRVLRLGGFTGTEAAAYLDRRAPGMAGALRGAVLDRARQPQDGGYNPFELAAYAHWAVAEPGLDAAELRAAPGDPYVDRRIVGRVLSADVRGALEIAAELGRFDLDLLTPALLRKGIDPKRAFDGLAMYDWVNVVALGADGRARVIEVDEHLRDRLRAALPVADPELLGRDAAAVIDATPLPDLPVETVEAAVRLLPPEEAGELWARVEQRVLDGGYWGWAGQVSARAGAAVQAADRPVSILAAVFATQATAADRAGRSATRLWEAVEEHAGRHPDPGTRASLRSRALLGRGDLEGWTATTTPEIRVGQVDVPLGYLAGAVEVARPLRLPELHEVIVSLARRREVPGAHNAAAAVLAASQALAEADQSEAVHFAELALSLAQLPPGPPLLGWEPPGGLLNRCRAVRLTVAVTWGEPLDAVPWPLWRSEAVAGTGDIDAERVAAASVALELGHRAISPAGLRELEDLAFRSGSAPPEPLVVELAWAWAVLGDFGYGWSLLERRIEQAVEDGSDPDVIEKCRLAQLGLALRHRTIDPVPDLGHIERNGTEAEQLAARRLRAAVKGPDGDLPPPPHLSAGAPGRRGRALLDEGGYYAGSDPERAIALLGEAADLLLGADDGFGADQALLLGLLIETLSRRADRPMLHRWRAKLASDGPMVAGPDGAWPILVQAATDVVSGKTGTAALRTAETILMGRRPDPPVPAIEANVPILGKKSMLWRVGGAAAYLGSAIAAALLLPDWIGADGLQAVLPATLTVIMLGVPAIGAFLSGLGADSARRVAAGAWLAGVLLGGMAATFAPDGWRAVAIAAGLLPPAIAAAVYVRAWLAATSGSPAYALDVRLGGDTLDATLTELGPSGVLNGSTNSRFIRLPSTVRSLDDDLTLDETAPIRLELISPPGHGAIPVALNLAAALYDHPWERRLSAGVPAAIRSRIVVFRRAYGERLKTRRWLTARRETYLGPPHLSEGRKAPAPRVGVLGYRMIHLIGRPIDTAAGPRMRVTDASATATTKRANAGERLVGTELIDALGLVVLQAEPDERLRPLGESRAAFLALADSVFSRRAQAVLMLPPMPEAAAAEVTAMLRAAYPGRLRQPRPTDVLELALRVRRFLGPDADDDVLLFLRTR